MDCKICGAKDIGIVHFLRDDPVLECGHLQSRDPELHNVESVVYESEIRITSYMHKYGLSREDAQDRIVKECFESLPPKARLDTLKTLVQAKTTTPAVESSINGMKKSSQRYIRS
jgi:hypothetical protein